MQHFTTGPELAATEVVRCVQYMRTDIEVFEELLSMIEPLDSAKINEIQVTYNELNLH